MTHLAENRVPEPQNNSKNNGTNFTRGHTGQIYFYLVERKGGGGKLVNFLPALRNGSV